MHQLNQSNLKSEVFSGNQTHRVLVSFQKATYSIQTEQQNNLCPKAVLTLESFRLYAYWHQATLSFRKTNAPRYTGNFYGW